MGIENKDINQELFDEMSLRIKREVIVAEKYSAIATAKEFEKRIKESASHGWNKSVEEISLELQNEARERADKKTEELLPELKEEYQQMTVYEFAKNLGIRARGEELTRAEEKLAEELGFVIVFGYSDDCAEFRGAYHSEVDCFDGGRVYEDGDKYIDAVWYGDSGYIWSYNTNIEHATFDIVDYEKKFCKGIIFKK